jgi:hypothetical protein
MFINPPAQKVSAKLYLTSKKTYGVAINAGAEGHSPIHSPK